MINKKISITIDVESDWGGRANIDSINNGIEEGLPYVLDILKRYNIKATFFVLGEVIERYPDEIAKIKKQGHEIACHGLTHEDYSKLSQEQIIERLGKCKKIFYDRLGVYLKGFRAPQFKTNKKLFAALSKLDFSYDSSFVKSIIPGRYNKLFIKSHPYRIHNEIYEFPVSSVSFLKLPFGLLWMNLFRVGRINMFPQKKRLVFYLHLFDLLASKPKPTKGIRFLTKLWYNIKSKQAKNTFESLLSFYKKKNYKFYKVIDLYGEIKR